VATPAEVLGRSIVNGLDQQTVPFGQIGPKSLFSALTNPSWGTLFNLPVAQGAADNQRRSREPSARPNVPVVVTRASSVPKRATTQPPWSSTPVRQNGPTIVQGGSENERACAAAPKRQISRASRGRRR
jgi:hypothetical protein